MNLQQTVKRPSFLWSAVAILVTTLVTLALLGPVFGAMLQSRAGEPEVFSKLEQYQEKHTKDAAIYEARIKGRYLFSNPPPPPKKEEPKQVVQESEPEPDPQPDSEPEPQEPTEPPPPANYQGPDVRFVVGETVYFNAPSSSGQPFSVPVGQEMHGVKVLSTENVPKSVKLGHQRGEYDVEIFGNWNMVARVTSPDETDEPKPTPFLQEVEQPTEEQEDAGGKTAAESPTQPEAEETEPSNEESAAAQADENASSSASEEQQQGDAGSAAEQSDEPAAQPADASTPRGGREHGNATERDRGAERNGSGASENSRDEDDAPSKARAGILPRDGSPNVRSHCSAGRHFPAGGVITGGVTRWPVAT